MNCRTMRTVRHYYGRHSHNTYCNNLQRRVTFLATRVADDVDRLFAKYAFSSSTSRNSSSISSISHGSLRSFMSTASICGPVCKIAINTSELNSLGSCQYSYPSQFNQNQRHFSSKGFNNSNNTNNTNNNYNNSNSKSPFATVQEKAGKIKKRKVKVPIKQTPRGQVAARLKVVTGDNNNNTDMNMNNNGTLAHIYNDNTTAIDDNINFDNQSHDHTHFVRGGTPCDPAAPPFHLADYGDESLYTLVLLRHGESEWNSQNRYTGWCDVNLTEKGRLEARAAGRLLKENDIELDHVFTSVLKRANFTTNMALNTSGQHYVPVTKSWRLNERHYGALQGYNKDTAYEELGIDQELVMEMRRSYDTRPPIMQDDHPFWHGNDRR